MRIACIYWATSSVGGIATHLNNLRLAAIDAGDEFDILQSRDWKTKQPCKFKERQWVRGGDTKIWIDGEVPQTKEGAQWLQRNYDAIYFGFICPHPTKAYPDPKFLCLFDTTLPMVAGVTDGYWDDYADWGDECLKCVKAVVVVQPTYALPVRKTGFNNIHVMLAPFKPMSAPYAKKTKHPLLIWPNQWKDIKGITKFLRVIPDISDDTTIEMYSNGIKYYQLRTTDEWKAAIGQDHLDGYHGNGRATFFGNVDLPLIAKAYQRTWYTVNLQGMSSRKEAYKAGSYNLTEVEALFYGACPILHYSTLKTALPKECYIPVVSAEDIPKAVSDANDTKWAINPDRQRIAREYILDNHLASRHWAQLRKLF